MLTDTNFISIMNETVNFGLGLLFTFGGLYIYYFTISVKEKSNKYSTTRTLGGSVLLVIIGILALLGKWDFGFLL